MRTLASKTSKTAVVTIISLTFVACSSGGDQADSRPAPDASVDIGADVGQLDARDVADAPVASDAADTSPEADSTLPDANSGDADADEASDGGDAGPSFVEGAPPDGHHQVSPGVGQGEFTSLRQGDTVRWERGPQGGYHVWVALRVDAELLEGLDDDELDATYQRFRLERADGTLLASTQRLGALQEDEGGWVGLGQYAVLEAPVRPTRLTGEALLYRVSIEPPSGNSASSQVWVISDCCD